MILADETANFLHSFDCDLRKNYLNAQHLLPKLLCACTEKNSQEYVYSLWHCFDHFVHLRCRVPKSEANPSSHRKKVQTRDLHNDKRLLKSHTISYGWKIHYQTDSEDGDTISHLVTGSSVKVTSRGTLGYSFVSVSVYLCVYIHLYLPIIHIYPCYCTTHSSICPSTHTNPSIHLYIVGYLRKWVKSCHVLNQVQSTTQCTYKY
jgi:hypothetical protein